MNYRLVALILGTIVALEGLLMGVCWLYSELSSNVDEEAMQLVWGISVCSTFTIGVLVIYAFRKSMTLEFSQRDALAIVGLSWIVAGAFGALPFILAPLEMPIWDCIFEAYSGLTTTGATVMSELDTKPRSMLLWRTLLQWIGGLGIVILFVALLGFFNVGGKSLFTREASAATDLNLEARIKTLGYGYLAIYVGFTILAALLLILCGTDLFESINLAMCGIATAGFSPTDASAGHLNWPAQVVLILAMLIGGIALPLHYQVLFLRRLEAVKKNTEFHVYVCLGFFATVIVAANLFISGEHESEGTGGIILDSAFQVVSILTTTGFTNTNFDSWPPLSEVILLGLMIMGGCAGSTSGGMKIARFIIFFKVALRQIRCAFRPHLILKLSMNGRTLSETVAGAVVFYFAVYFFVMATGVIGLALMEPHISLRTIISAVLATLNNIGPGLDLIGPSQNYSFFNPVSKMWLCLLMLIGRLEFFAVLVLFLPSFWRKF